MVILVVTVQYYYLKPLSQNGHYLKPLSQNNNYLKPLSQILFITFVSIFLVGIGAIIYILEDGELLPEYIIVGLAIVIFYLYTIIPQISMHRLRVNHSIDELVFDSILLGRRWRSKRKILSDSLYVRYHKHVTYNENNQSETHHEYNVHGKSDGGRDWKLDISNM